MLEKEAKHIQQNRMRDMKSTFAFRIRFYATISLSNTIRNRCVFLVNIEKERERERERELEWNARLLLKRFSSSWHKDLTNNSVFNGKSKCNGFSSFFLLLKVTL